MSAITKRSPRIDTVAHFIRSNMFANAQLDDARAQSALHIFSSLKMIAVSFCLFRIKQTIFAKEEKRKKIDGSLV